MATKKVTRSDHGQFKTGIVTYHGIKIAPASGKRSETAKIIKEELLQRSEARGQRKSA